MAARTDARFRRVLILRRSLPKFQRIGIKLDLLLRGYSDRFHFLGNPFLSWSYEIETDQISQLYIVHLRRTHWNSHRIIKSFSDFAELHHYIRHLYRLARVSPETMWPVLLSPTTETELPESTLSWDH